MQTEGLVRVLTYFHFVNVNERLSNRMEKKGFPLLAQEDLQQIPSTKLGKADDEGTCALFV